MRLVLFLSCIVSFFRYSYSQDTLHLEHQKGLVLSFNGSTISNAGFKYRLTNKTAITSFIEFNSSKTKTNSSNDWLNDLNATTYYYGLGIFAQFSLYQTEPIQFYTTIKTWSNQYYASAGVGVECWILKNISLAGQHLFTGSYTSSKTEELYKSKTHSYTNLNSRESTLILCFYF
ncbi:MAG: hypothetical protein HY800_08660 [Ignavibacteriales bacterium]|nr:hypothetical protein [Ignavibacteriales bacterium]